MSKLNFEQIIKFEANNLKHRKQIRNEYFQGMEKIYMQGALKARELTLLEFSDCVTKEHYNKLLDKYSDCKRELMKGTL